MGAHIDGFIAVVAHTVVIGAEKVGGKQADALLAAHLASEAAVRLIKPGNEVCFTSSILGSEEIILQIRKYDQH